jgi:Icc-related predicted phosphoesterase
MAKQLAAGSLAAATTLRVVGLVDLHWSGRRPLELPDLSQVDLVLLGGDLTHFAGAAVARRLVDSIRAAGPAVLAVCGNCDHQEVEDYLFAEGVALDRRAQVAAGAVVAGVSGGLPFGGCPYERSEADFAAAGAEARDAAIAIGASGPTILVSHQPPYGTRCDRVLRMKHVGSHSIRRLVDEWQPDLVLCGHIHESRGRDRVGRSLVVNPGPWRSGHSLRFDVGPAGIDLRGE